MLLTKLLSALDNVSMPENDYEICDIVYDSRKATEGSLFVCLKGYVVDGHDFAKSAYERGCRVFLAQRHLNLPDDSLTVIVEDTRAALPLLSESSSVIPKGGLSLSG